MLRWFEGLLRKDINIDCLMLFIGKLVILLNLLILLDNKASVFFMDMILHMGHKGKNNMKNYNPSSSPTLTRCGGTLGHASHANVFIS